jgi:acyl carrier protein
MGLDTVELVITIEHEFNITIPDADAEALQTCGQLCAYVLRRTNPHPTDRAPCPQARAFYHLRRALMRQLPHPRPAFRPATKLADVMTDPYRDRWPAVAREIGLEHFYSFNRKTQIFFPAAYTRLSDLARRMALPKPYDPPELAGPVEQQVWQRIRQLVSEQTGVRIDDIHPHSHFINDLNMD